MIVQRPGQQPPTQCAKHNKEVNEVYTAHSTRQAVLVSEEYGTPTVYNEKRWCHSRTYMDLWDVDALVQRDTAPMGLDPAS